MSTAWLRNAESVVAGERSEERLPASASDGKLCRIKVPRAPQQISCEAPVRPFSSLPPPSFSRKKCTVLISCLIALLLLFGRLRLPLQRRAGRIGVSSSTRVQQPLAKICTLPQVRLFCMHSSLKDNEGYADPVSRAVESWYNEGLAYKYSAPGFSPATGHFTQVVWGATKALGCGSATGCKGGGALDALVVCRYSPPGNYIGEARQLHATIHSSHNYFSLPKM